MIGPLIGVAAQVLPSIISAIAGDKAGRVAEGVASAATAVFGSSDPDLAAAGIQDPEKRAAFLSHLKDVELEYRRIEAEELKAHLADIANARAQTLGLAQAGSAIAWGAPVMTAINTLGFFVVLIVILTTKQSWNEVTSTLITTMVGFLGGAYSSSNNYWLGSSSGSKRSGDAVRDIAIRASTTQPSPVGTTADDLNNREFNRIRQ